MQYQNEFRKQTQLIKTYGEGNAYLAWVMALYLDQSDVFDLAANSLTDGSNDKKIDFINLDLGIGKITIAQGYYSDKNKEAAPSDKASDLNTAVAWLVSGKLRNIPENLQEIIKDCREAINSDEISTIELLYVHNLPESENCRKELSTASEHLSNLLSRKKIDVLAQELGKTTVEELYITKESQIVVKKAVDLPLLPLYDEGSVGWKAYIYSVTGSWLKEQYKKYGEKLFSANYRGFLGIGKRKKINNAIRQTGESEPENFWVFNNGITILTNKIDIDKKQQKTTLHGLSVINGAQTTGSIGTIEKEKQLGQIKVLCRIIECSVPDLIAKIVKANNSQNEITSWDTYSNNSIQKSLKESFAAYSKNYSLKRGFDDMSNPLGIYNVAQPTLAFEGNYREANRGKNYIFFSTALYDSIFHNGTKARHLLLTYTLSKSFDEVKIKIKGECSKKVNLTQIEKKELELFRNLKFKMFFISLVASCLENLLGIPIDRKTVSISTKYASNEMENIIETWNTAVESILSLLVTQTLSNDISEYINNESQYDLLCKNLNSLIAAFEITSGNKFDSLKKMISES